MKRTIDERMMACCRKQHRPTAQSVSHGMMFKVLEKATVGAFDGQTRVHPVAPAAISPTGGGIHSSIAHHTPLPSAEVEYPPPDLIIQNLNLRI